MASKKVRPEETAAVLIAVTGATGYIGSALTRHLLANGHRMRALTRSRPTQASVQHVSYDLRKELEEGALQGVAAVVHLAAETARGSESDVDVELSALRRLLAAAGQARARFVFVSSQSASPNAPTCYGLSKWRAEREVLAQGGLVIRPGLVYGGPERGLFGTLCRFIRLAPVVPVLKPAPQVQPIHVDDLANVLLRVACERPFNEGVLCIGEPRPRPFDAFLAAIAEHRVDRPVIRIPIPLSILLPLLAVAKPVLGNVADAGRIRSLAKLPTMDTQASLDQLGISLCRLEDGLTRSGRSRRRRLIEGHTIFRYLLGAPVSLSALGRYARTMEAQGVAPLHFRRWMRAAPLSLLLLDQPTLRAHAPTEEFYRRLELATVLGETIPKFASRYIAVDRGLAVYLRLVRLAGCLCLEGAVRAMAIPLRGALARCVRSLSDYRL